MYFYVPNDARNVVVNLLRGYSWEIPVYDGQGFFLGWQAVSGNVGATVTAVSAGATPVVLYGDDRDSTLYVGPYSDVFGGLGNELIGGGDFSTVRGGGGLDDIRAGADNRVDGGNGDDNIHAGARGLVFGGDDNDVIFAGESSTVRGGDGNDVIVITPNSVLEGDDGADSFTIRDDGIGAGGYAVIDGGGSPLGQLDAIVVIGPARPYTLAYSNDYIWTTVAFTGGPTLLVKDVEKLRSFEVMPIQNGVTNLWAGEMAGEAAHQAAEVYAGLNTSVGRRGWHDLASIEVGMLPTGATADGGSYTFRPGMFSYEGRGLFGKLKNTSAVSIVSGVVDGVRTVMITFKGSDEWTDESTKDPRDWIYDVTNVMPFYEKHRPLIDALTEFLADPMSDIGQVILSGHSLGGAMTQHLAAELANSGFQGRVTGYTFGSIGGEAPTLAGARSHLVNFMHIGDPAHFTSLIRSKAGPVVLMDSSEGVGNMKTLHGIELYDRNIARLIDLADDPGQFYNSLLAASLRQATQWTGESTMLLSGTRSTIRVFVGNTGADTFEVSAANDFTLGGGGDDTFTLAAPGPIGRRFIDGGIGNDTLRLAGASKDFRLTASGGTTAIQHVGSSVAISFAEVANVEKVLFDDRPLGLDGTVLRKQVLAAPAGAAAAGIGTGDQGQVSAAAAAGPVARILPGYDFAEAGDGKMSIAGTAGGDILYVGRGDKTIAMGEGNDVVIVKTAPRKGALKEKVTIDGGSGADLMHGGRGAETFIVDDARDIVHDDGGKDAIHSSVDYVLPGEIETLVLTGSAKLGTGNKGANTIVGNGKANALDGLQGNDTIAGGKGKDTIAGGAGKDSLTGAAGSDTFVFSAKPGSKNVDTISDFKHNTDLIALDDANFSAMGPTLDKAEFYVAAGATKAHDKSDRIIYDSKSGKLYFDEDGNKKGGHEAVLFATLSNKPALDHGDFEIV